MIEIDGIHYALVALSATTASDNHMSDPSHPVPAASLTDGEDGFEELDESSSIAATQDRGEILRAGNRFKRQGHPDIDITDPANPSRRLR